MALELITVIGNCRKGLVFPPKCSCDATLNDGTDLGKLKEFDVATDTLFQVFHVMDEIRPIVCLHFWRTAPEQGTGIKTNLPTWVALVERLP